MQNPPTEIVPAPTPAKPKTFREKATTYALAQLTDIVGKERAASVAASFGMAYATLAKVNPNIEKATPASVGMTIAMCVLSELRPGGAMPTCYIIPRERRFKDEHGVWCSEYELNFQIGFRGLLTLAQRAGYMLQAYPVYPGRAPQFGSDGSLILPTERLPAPIRTLDNLIGVIVKARRLSDGASFGEVFVEYDQIAARRDVSDSYQRGMETTYSFGRDKGKAKSADDIARARSSPWFQWEEDMVLKTALIYAIRRGLVPVDDSAGEILRADVDADRPTVIDVEHETVTPTGGRAALGVRTAPAIAQDEPTGEWAPNEAEREAITRDEQQAK